MKRRDGGATLDLFGERRDRPAAEAAREEAIDKVELGASPLWLTRALAAVQAVAELQETFTTDDLWAHVEHPAEPRALGAVLRAARRAGICEATARTVRSERVTCHARPLRVWRSLVRKGGDSHGDV